MEIGFFIFLFIIGACIGSFLCCQARRLHYGGTHRHKLHSKRSICMHCKKPLAWYDNIPLVSWSILRGKCRHCHHSIGIAESLSELLAAGSFLLLGSTINLTSSTILEWAIFILILIFTSVLIFLGIYDGLYGELPTIFLIIAIVIGCIVLALHTWQTVSLSKPISEFIINALIAILILGGTYLLLYLISKGRLVGDGDWLLATAMAIVLAHPLLALVALFLANFIACLVMLPTVKGNTKAKIHFGPFLVAGFVIAYSFSHFFITFML